MDSLYLPLPNSVEIGGYIYPIETDFRLWIEFQERFFDENTTEDDRTSLIFAMLKDIDQIANLKTAEDMKELVFEIFRFFAMKPVGEEETAPSSTAQNKEPSYDFTVDADRIFSLFWIYYQIDLFEIPYLHWWKFIALLSDPPETSDFARAISIRNANIQHLKGEDQKRMKQQKEHYKIKGKASKKSLEEIANEQTDRIKQRLEQG